MREFCARVVAIGLAVVLVGAVAPAVSAQAPPASMTPGAAYARSFEDVITRLYLGVLGRQPDSFGLGGWTAHLREHRGSLESIGTAFVESEEYTARYGRPDDTTFVTLLYRNALRRDPGPQGLANWVSALAGGTSRGAVAAAFAESAEAVAVTGTLAPPVRPAGVDAAAADAVARLYLGLLGRAPDPAGGEGWARQLAAGTTIETLATAFIGSAEYAVRHGQPDDTTFVTLLYRNGLGREPDPGGLAGWVQALASGTSRGAVAAGITQSPEAVAVSGTLPPPPPPPPPKPAPKPPSSSGRTYGLPANSGTGRRIVYDNSAQRVWAVDSSGQVVKTHLVSGRLGRPSPGTYYVFSRSRYTYYPPNPAVQWEYMVRFVRGSGGLSIGFHQIPTKNGVPVQSISQLGTPRSLGCVRQSPADARWMWNWAGIGTKVVVVP